MTIQLTTRSSFYTFAQVLRVHESFKTYGKFEGQAGKPGDFTHAFLGQLQEPYRTQFTRTADRIDYVVYSYATPIAWHNEMSGEWVTTDDASYSPRTTTHQSKIYTAISVL
jgi:hypothetical protein